MISLKVRDFKGKMKHGWPFLVVCMLSYMFPSTILADTPDKVVSIASSQIFTNLSLSTYDRLHVEIVDSPYPHQRTNHMKSIFVFSKNHRRGSIFSFYGLKQLDLDLSSIFEADISDVELVDYNQDGSPDLLLSSAESGPDLNGEIALWQYGLAYSASTNRLDQATPLSVVRTGGTREQIGGKLLALPSLGRSGVLVQHPTLNAVYFMSQIQGHEWIPFAIQDSRRHPGFGFSMGLMTKDALCGPSGRDYVAFLSHDGTLFSYDPFHWRLISQLPLISRGIVARPGRLSASGADLVADPDGRCADFVVPDTSPSNGGGTQIAVAFSHGRLEGNTAFVTTDASSLRNPTEQVATLKLFGDDRRWQDPAQDILSGTPVLLARNSEKILYLPSHARRTNTDIESTSITCTGACVDMTTGELNGDSWDELVTVEGEGANSTLNVYSHGGGYLLSHTSTTTSRDGTHFGSLYLGISNSGDSTGAMLKAFGPALDNGNATHIILQFSRETTAEPGIDIGLTNDHRLQAFAGSAHELIASAAFPVGLNQSSGHKEVNIPFELGERILSGTTGSLTPLFSGLTVQAVVVNTDSVGEPVVALSQGYRLTTVPHIEHRP